MGAPDLGETEPPSDAVDQARAWLAATTGQSAPAPTEPEFETGGLGTDRSVRRTSRSGGASSSGCGADAHASDGPRNSSPMPTSASGGSGTAGSATTRLGQDPTGPDGPDADPESVARTIALRKLTAQARTRHELDQALQKKNVPDEVAASVLDRLEEVGLVDDKTFAEDWVASRQQRRHLSRSALRRELRGKGVDREHVDSALATVDTGDELSAARALIAKKATATRDLDPQVRYRRLAGVLARRGFGAGITATVLAELDDELGEEPGA